MQNIKNAEQLKLKEVWKNFDTILGIPHPSGGAEKLADHIMEFGKKLGLDSKKDKASNVIIRKPASKGMENAKTVIIQSHVDMVPQQNKGRNHNFETDPIKAYVEDGWVKAEGTTLGADNGIAVAYSMTILEDKTLKHGPLEVLFTMDEETGMFGAMGIEDGELKGSVLVNIDGEGDGEITVGCAGGANTTVEFKYTEMNPMSDASAYELTISGLKGGHSGADIHLGRGNANKILSRILVELGKKYKYQLSSIYGGTVRNAIPRESGAEVVVSNHDKKSFIADFEEIGEKIKSVLSSDDSHVKFTAKEIALPSKVIDENSANAIITGAHVAPNGVIKYSFQMKGLVETSTNLSQVVTGKGKVSFLFLSRSSVEFEKMEVCNIIDSLFKAKGAIVIHDTFYPGWDPDMNSQLLNLGKEIYKEINGEYPKVEAIHAGLECGYLKEKFPHVDMASFGVNISFAHSPEERVEVKSVEKTWILVKKLLENIK